jgi:hypothetical protein
MFSLIWGIWTFKKDMKAARQWKLVGTREDDGGQYDPSALSTSIKMTR